MSNKKHIYSIFLKNTKKKKKLRKKKLLWIISIILRDATNEEKGDAEREKREKGDISDYRRFRSMVERSLAERQLQR